MATLKARMDSLSAPAAELSCEARARAIFVCLLLNADGPLWALVTIIKKRHIARAIIAIEIYRSVWPYEFVLFIVPSPSNEILADSFFEQRVRFEFNTSSRIGKLDEGIGRY